MVATTERGSWAETLVAQRLDVSGYTVIARNWRTKWCEIDIIAKRDSVIYLIEVRYRQNNQAGDGLASITVGKHRRMRRAAQIWLPRHSSDDVCLCVASVNASHSIQWAVLD